MLKAGVAQEYRDKIVGHSLKGMDTHYLVIYEEDLSAAMETYTAWFDNNLASVTQNVDQEHKQGSAL